MKNRRTEHRRKVSLLGKIRSNGQWHDVRARNMSVGGARIVLDFPLLEGSKVQIAFGLPSDNGDATQLETLGLVIWCTEDMEVGFHAGIRFSPEVGDTQADLREFLEAYPEA